MREAQAWWKKAKGDLDVAKYNLDGDMLDAAAFFAQQAAEKALKSLQNIVRHKTIYNLTCFPGMSNPPYSPFSKGGFRGIFIRSYAGYYKKFAKFEKTHDLVLIAKHIGAPEKVIALTEKITPFYTITRYPDVEISYDKREVSSIIEASEEVMEWVKRELD